MEKQPWGLTEVDLVGIVVIVVVVVVVVVVIISVFASLHIANYTECHKGNVIHRMISRVSNKNGVSLLYIMLEIHHSGREPSIFKGKKQRNKQMKGEPLLVSQPTNQKLTMPLPKKNKNSSQKAENEKIMIYRRRNPFWQEMACGAWLLPLSHWTSLEWKWILIC